MSDFATEPVLVWDLEVGVDADPAEPVEHELAALDPGPVGGVAVWFEADLDDGIVMHNRPGEPNHWGQLVCNWSHERGLGLGGRISVRFTAGADGLEATPCR